MENQNNTHTNIQDLFNTYLEEGGKPAVTHFRVWLNTHIDEVIKPLCKSSSRSGSGLAGWKSELKDRFGGRGAKWVKISLQEIMPTLERIETEEGFDASHYRALINHAGFAWIRFDAPRVHNGKNCAAFKVLTEGSTFMQPGRLHFIDVSLLDEVITEDMKRYSIKVEGLTEHSGGFYLYNTTSCKMTDFKQKMQEMLPKVGGYAISNNIRMAGAPFVIYHKWDEANDAVMFSCAIPTSSKITTTESEILTGQLQPFKTVKTILYGDYENLKEMMLTKQ